MRMNCKEQNKYTMDLKQADQTLQNIFAACEQKPNTIPFDKIVLRQRAKTRSFTLGKYLCLLFIVLLFIVPFVFPHSHAKISSTQNYSSNLEVESHYVSGSQFTLFLSGEDIDYADSYASAADGTIYLPVGSDATEHKIVFPYVGKEVNIYIYDSKGNYIQLLLTPLQEK